MIFYKCDECKKEKHGDAPVVLTGYSGGSGILLPEAFHVKHFCCRKCFLRWVEKTLDTHRPGPDK